MYGSGAILTCQYLLIICRHQKIKDGDLPSKVRNTSCAMDCVSRAPPLCIIHVLSFRPHPPEKSGLKPSSPTISFWFRYATVLSVVFVRVSLIFVHVRSARSLTPVFCQRFLAYRISRVLSTIPQPLCIPHRIMRRYIPLGHAERYARYEATHFKARRATKMGAERHYLAGGKLGR